MQTASLCRSTAGEQHGDRPAPSTPPAACWAGPRWGSHFHGGGEGACPPSISASISAGPWTGREEALPLVPEWSLLT